jgi:hypothetical protein
LDRLPYDGKNVPAPLRRPFSAQLAVIYAKEKLKREAERSASARDLHHHPKCWEENAQTHGGHQTLNGLVRLRSAAHLKPTAELSSQ